MLNFYFLGFKLILFCVQHTFLHFSQKLVGDQTDPLPRSREPLRACGSHGDILSIFCIPSHLIMKSNMLSDQSLHAECFARFVYGTQIRERRL